MRAVILLIVLALVAGLAQAQSIIVVSESAQVRAQPSAKSKAVGLVFGDETFDVLESKDGWFRIRNRQQVEGWVSVADADDPVRVVARAGEPRSVAYTRARALQRVGNVEQARAGFVAVIQTYPDTYESYQSLRHLARYHKLQAPPKPMQGRVTVEQLAVAHRAAGAILGAEARALTAAGRLAESLRVLQSVRTAAGEAYALDAPLMAAIDELKRAADKAGDDDVEDGADALRAR